MPSTNISGMPAHYEMLVSHSPPVFSHSPPAGFLSDYGTNINRYFDPTRTFCRSQGLTPIQSRQKFHQAVLKMPSVPQRPILVVKNDSTAALSDRASEQTQPQQPTDQKTKKKVVFADDKGKSLTEVRIMKEPSNVPPLWSIEFLAHVTQGLISPELTEEWMVNFRQPASDYLDFRQKLETNNVSLENVIVKENDSIVVGTVKVKNVSFHKEVIVRTTWDDWKSQEDIFCTYSPIGGNSGTYVLYDTFSFKLTLPPLSNKLEFCVCFRSDSNEYWDSNGGKNYCILKRTSNFGSQNSSFLLKTKSTTTTQPISIPQKYSDLSQAKMTAWSEFASWNHLENNCPYW